jgi:ABC-type nitrate/sulfonate/bicarbonate transport system ATPase subunit
MNESTLDLLENQLIIQHRNFVETQAEILRGIQHGRSDEPICVIGPTGIGKTKLQHFLADYLIGRQAKDWRSDCHPPLLIEAPAAEKGKFPWRSFLEDLLTNLGEIDLTAKVDFERVDMNRKLAKRAPPRTKLSEAGLERLLRIRVNALRPIVIFIDECQNLVDNVSDIERKANVNRIKSWANTMRTKIVLFGTHEAQALLNLNEQLARRVSPIYFPRYKRDDEHDVNEFASFYMSIIDHADIRIDPACHKDFYNIYDYSLGSPGLLVSWLHKAMVYCIDRNLPKITEDILKRTRYSKDCLQTVELAVKNFEVYQESTYENFNPALILPDEPLTPDMFGASQPMVSRPSKRKPGTKNPKSYQVHANKF